MGKTMVNEQVILKKETTIKQSKVAKKGLKKHKENILIHIIIILACLACVIPFLLLISVSLSSEVDILEYGYRLIPKNIDFTAYNYILRDPGQVISAYQVTIFSSIVGTIISLTIMAMAAYALSRTSFSYKKQVSFVIFFSMLFSGGLVPSYILITQYLNLKDNIWVYILPSLVNGFYVFMMRSFFSDLPEALFESAKIDGANELRIFFQIAIQLSKPVLATVALFGVLQRWNDWFTALLYIEKQNLMSLQYLLQRIMKDIELVRQNQDLFPELSQMINLPNDSLRMAMAMVCAGPILIVFPFFQKYFVRGLTVGSVKG